MCLPQVFLAGELDPPRLSPPPHLGHRCLGLSSFSLLFVVFISIEGDSRAAGCTPAGDWILHPTATRGQHRRQQQRLRDQVLQPLLKVRGVRWAGGQVVRAEVDATDGKQGAGAGTLGSEQRSSTLSTRGSGAERAEGRREKGFEVWEGGAERVETEDAAMGRDWTSEEGRDGPQ